jgi:hypothetical protein
MTKFDDWFNGYMRQCPIEKMTKKKVSCVNCGHCMKIAKDGYQAAITQFKKINSELSDLLLIGEKNDE